MIWQKTCSYKSGGGREKNSWELHIQVIKNTETIETIETIETCAIKNKVNFISMVGGLKKE